MPRDISSSCLVLLPVCVGWASEGSCMGLFFWHNQQVSPGQEWCKQLPKMVDKRSGRCEGNNMTRPQRHKCTTSICPWLLHLLVSLVRVPLLLHPHAAVEKPLLCAHHTHGPAC